MSQNTNNLKCVKNIYSGYTEKIKWHDLTKSGNTLLLGSLLFYIIIQENTRCHTSKPMSYSVVALVVNYLFVLIPC